MDLAFLKTLYQYPGPYVSVYADLTRTTEDASKVAELRWRALRADLEAQNAARDTLHAIEQIIAESQKGHALMVVGTHGPKGLRQSLLGADILKLVRHVHIPSLVVQAESAGQGLGATFTVALPKVDPVGASALLDGPLREDGVDMGTASALRQPGSDST